MIINDKFLHLKPRYMFIIPAEEPEYIKSERLAQIATVSPEKMQPDIVSVDFDFG